MLAEVEAAARETLEHTGTLDQIGSDNAYGATERVRQSVLEARRNGAVAHHPAVARPIRWSAR